MTPEPDETKPTGLRRSTKRRMIGGVAGGIGERFDIDPNIVRVIFVVLTVLYGLGAAIYLAMWVLIPQAGGRGDDPVESGEAPPATNMRLLSYVLLAGVVVAVVIVLSTLGGAPRVGNGFGDSLADLSGGAGNIVATLVGSPAHAPAIPRSRVPLLLDGGDSAVGCVPRFPRVDGGSDVRGER